MLDLSQLRSGIRSEGGVTRRLFLAYGASLAALPYLGTKSHGVQNAKFDADPFSLGVASGEPAPGGMVLWTRLAPKPLDEDYGLPPESINVAWEVANDEKFANVVKKGTAVATPQLGHSVHAEVEGLEPDRWYFYRFRTGDATSPVGRTRTAPANDAAPEKLKFAFASCQHYEQGLFTAYDHMAKDDLDLVVHLGDYIYEYPVNAKKVRKHNGPAKAKIRTLDEYRQRHALYRTDPLLQKMHASCPWLVTWDDHEFDNNYANGIAEKRTTLPPTQDPVEFLEQRAAAYQAYYEAMPLRAKSVPQGPHMKIYRTSNFGRLAAFQVLDTRQYRTDQPNDDKAADLNDAALDPKNSLLGAEQANWLKAALLKSPAVWNVLAQQVMMGMVDLAAGVDKRYSMDQWCSAAAERMKLMKWIAERKVTNPVVLTGDIHSNWANDLRVDDRDGEAPVVAAEFVGTSISSGGNGIAVPKNLDTLLGENPFVKFHNRQRGYVRCTVTPKVWKADYQIVEDVTKPDGPVETKASFALEAGKAGLQKA